MSPTYEKKKKHRCSEHRTRYRRGLRGLLTRVDLGLVTARATELKCLQVTLIPCPMEGAARRYTGSHRGRLGASPGRSSRAAGGEHSAGRPATVGTAGRSALPFLCPLLRLQLAHLDVHHFRFACRGPRITRQVDQTHLRSTVESKNLVLSPWQPQFRG